MRLSWIVAAWMSYLVAFPAWPDEESYTRATEEFNRAREVAMACINDRAALSARSSLSDQDAAAFVIDACRTELKDNNFWRCSSSLDSSNPFLSAFESLYSHSATPLQSCQEHWNERDAEGLPTLSLTIIMRSRYE